jgi:pyrroline-5-carboxylate reductase
MNRVGFIGGGRIVNIFLQALHNKRFEAAQIVVSDPDSQAVSRLAFGKPNLNISPGSAVDAANQELVFLAVHPPVFKHVLPEIASSIQNAKAVVSLAPVYKSSRLLDLLNGFNRIVRMIPNAATLMNSGYNPVWFAESFTAAEKKNLLDFFALFGQCPQVDEEKLEAYAVLTAMGPTYLWPHLDELKKLGIEFGLTDQEAIAALKAMTRNTLELLFDSGMPYEEMADLIPVKPLEESETQIRAIYHSRLTSLYKKLAGQ